MSAGPVRAGSARRYALFQIPGALLLASALWFAAEREWVGGRLALLLWGLWVVKDIALYPVLRSAYTPDHDDPGETLRGREGVARDAIGPRDRIGYVALGPELWRAVLAEESALVATGDRVEVREVRGMTLVVRRVDLDTRD